MNLFSILNVTSSALTAERVRAEVEASNLANAETTRTESGKPYQRKMVAFGSSQLNSGSFGSVMARFEDKDFPGIKVRSVVTDTTPPLRRFEPGHPDADAEGYVSFPAINPIETMANLTGAARAYQLNAAAAQATKGMITASLDIIK